MTKGHEIYHARHAKKLELLLLNGAIRQLDFDCGSILFRYIQQVPGDVEVEMIILFLKHGLKVNTLNKHGQTLLTVAVSLLQDWCLKGMQPKDMATVSNILAKAQSLFELLVDAGADPNGGVTSSRNDYFTPSASTDPPPSSPLGSLLMQTHPVAQVPYFLRFSLDRGAEPRATDGKARTPLHDQAECIVELLARGASADVNMPDYKGWTPLALACGATRDAALKWKRDPVSIARRVEIIKILVHSGADVGAKDITGRDALDWAVYWGLPELEGCLLSFGA
ncbi:hypothetical protein DL770_004805 [Monosporascus sp. CRB-9-2]|nr:hypothetical protein DL770_004805 [Monosporascus sp. CRB-9-2]